MEQENLEKKNTSRSPRLDLCSVLTCCIVCNLQQVANLLCAQANSASYPKWGGNFSNVCNW